MEESVKMYTISTCSHCRAAKRFLSLDLCYLGAVPEDKAIRQALREQSPFILTLPESKTSRAVFSLADRVQMLQ